MNEMKKKMNIGASVVIVVLMLTMLFTPLSSAAPIQPFERSGTTTANTVVTAWIDGVQYGSNTSDASGNFVIDVNGDDVDTTTVKEGGQNGNTVTYMIGGSFATETDTFTSGSSVTGDLSVAATQPAMLKISKIVTQPNDGNANQCVYIYNPTASPVDLTAYQLEKDDSSYSSSVISLSGTVAAGGFAYVELTSTYFNTAGDEVKLNFTTTGMIVDRVEFGTQSIIPDNTIMGDAPAPGLGEEIYRTPNPDTDTDDCSVDFTTGPATDRIAPTSSVDALPTYETSTTFTVTATATDDNSGVASVTLYWSTSATPIPYSNSAAMTFVSGTSWSYDFTGTDGTTYYFYTVATDVEGNVEADPAAYDASTTIDATAPVSSADALPAYESSGTFTVTATATDATSGVASVELYWSTSATPIPYTSSAAMTLVSGTSWSYTFTTPLADGTYYFYTVATDNAGNVEGDPAAYDTTTIVDSSLPTSSVDALPAYETALAFTVTATATDAVSGVASVELYWSTSATPIPYSNSAAMTLVSGTSWTYDFTGTDGTTYYFYTVATDNAGNVEGDPAAYDATTTVDTTAPTVISTTPANAATGVSVSANIIVVYSETMDNTVTPTISDSLSTTYTFVAWSTTTVTDDTATWTHADWTASTTVDPTVSGGQDLAGNVQTPYSWSFTTAGGAGTAAVATSLWVEKDSANNNIILHWTDTGSTEWHVYASQNRFNVTDPANLIATVTGPASAWTHVGAYGDGLNWFYVVRGYDGVSVESTNSTMGYKTITTLGYNDPSLKANGYWVSIPYNTTYYKDLESIIIDIEGGLTGSDDTYINAVSAWDGASQARVGETVGGFGWTGTNVALNPGDAVYIARSDVTPAPYDWIVNGTDADSVVTLGYNDPSLKANGYWVSVPPSGVYTDLESIIIDIEGGLTGSDDVYINAVSAWDGASQARVGETVGGFGWTGTNVALNPGDAVYIARSDVTPAPYDWSVEVITPAVA